MPCLNERAKARPVVAFGPRMAGFGSWDWVTYDAAGNRISRQELGGSRVTWAYDAQNQLLAENRTGMSPYRQTYTYDPAGNRLLLNNTGTRTTYAYDAGNQLIYGQAAAGRTTYSFDAAGNQQRSIDPTGARTTTTWNFDNQPTLYRFPLGTRATYLYNADNRRVQGDA